MPFCVADLDTRPVTHDVHGAVEVRGDDGHLVQAVVREHGTFDLAELHAVAANLHLVVDTADVEHVSVAQHAHLVARAIQPALVLAGGEGILHKGGCSLLRQLVVAARDLATRMHELAGRAHGHAVHLLVHHVAADVQYGLADGDVF